MLFPALCALREHFASALAVSLGSHGLLSRRDLFQENMSLSDSKQTTTHGRADGLPPLQVLIEFVHPPLWPGAALQPALGCGFVQISAAASCRMEDLAGWGYWGIACCHMWPAALSSVPVAQNNGRVLAVSSWEWKGVHMMYKKPQPHSMNVSQASMGLSLGARVGLAKLQPSSFTWLHNPLLGLYTDRSELFQEACWG